MKKIKVELFKKLEDLKRSNTGQTMHVGTDHIYIEQNVKKTQQVMTRYYIGSDDVATFRDEEVFLNCGHNQLLEYIKDGWFCKFVKPVKGSKDKSWATQLAFFKYEPGKTIESYKEVLRFNELCENCYRAEGALSSDKKVLMVTAKNSGNKGAIHYLSTDKLLYAITHTKYKSIPIPSGAYVKSKIYLSPADFRNMSPFGSNQGMELSNDLKIYQSGGKIGGELGINYCNSKGKLLESAILEHPDFHTGQQEIEDIQLKGDYVYVLVGNKALPKYKNRIYRFRKSDIRG